MGSGGAAKRWQRWSALKGRRSEAAAYGLAEAFRPGISSLFFSQVFIPRVSGPGERFSWLVPIILRLFWQGGAQKLPFDQCGEAFAGGCRKAPAACDSL